MTEIEFGKRHYHLIGAMETWCKEYFGPRAYSKDNIRDDGELKNLWFTDGMFGNTTFTFKREQDAVLFSLKWK